MNMKTFNNKMKSFKQFINAQDSDTDPFLEMPIRVKASFFNPNTRTQVVFFQHVLLDRTQKQSPTSQNDTTNLPPKKDTQPI